ncbi:MAG: methyltransferase domain-containing protein [Rhodocyclaceae bacterium]|nr:methyltransferase domain-containing protein [Rhodocyclaceae bacterium]MDP1957829.1 methyltransferase domain-containing protein [Rhodocyclaceae bacterium]
MAIPLFSDWLDTPQGQYVRAWEQRKLDLLVADIFGFNAVQVGFPQLDFLRTNRMPFRVLCCDQGAVAVKSDPCFLPFAANSLDLIVLPHVLEFNANPQQILREVERVLVPEGSVVVTGFNPYSLWGLRRAMARRGGRPPWQGRYLSVSRLRDWFKLLGFETRSGAFGCYAPPVRQEKWLQRWRFMDAAGDRWWPITGAVYVLQAIKRQHGMRLITPKWHDRKAAARALAAVTRKPLTQKTEQE